jgi:hypothetical protein
VSSASEIPLPDYRDRLKFLRQSTLSASKFHKESHAVWVKAHTVVFSLDPGFVAPLGGPTGPLGVCGSSELGAKFLFYVPG